MQIEVTVLRAGMLRWLTWAGGGIEDLAQQLAIRDVIEDQISAPLAALGVTTNPDSPSFSGPTDVLMQQTLTIALSRADLEHLTNYIQAFRWQQELPGFLAREVVALPAWLRQMHQEASAEELLDAIPEGRRRQLLEKIGDDRS